MKKTFLALAKPDGSLDMTVYQRATLKDTIKENAGSRLRLVIERETPESNKQRRMFEGGYIPLWVYLDGADYRNADICIAYREVAKRRFNGEWRMIAGKSELVGKSTKGELNEGFLERLGDFIEEQYGVEKKDVLNPEIYKYWRDKVFPFGGPETFIEYLISIGKLK